MGNTRPGKHTKSSWTLNMAIEIVDFPIKNGGSSHSYVAVYQMVIVNVHNCDYIISLDATTIVYTSIATNEWWQWYISGKEHCPIEKLVMFGPRVRYTMFLGRTRRWQQFEGIRNAIIFSKGHPAKKAFHEIHGGHWWPLVAIFQQLVVSSLLALAG